MDQKIQDFTIKIPKILQKILWKEPTNLPYPTILSKHQTHSQDRLRGQIDLLMKNLMQLSKFFSKKSKNPSEKI